MTNPYTPTPDSPVFVHYEGKAYQNGTYRDYPGHKVPRGRFMLFDMLRRTFACGGGSYHAVLCMGNFERFCWQKFRLTFPAAIRGWV